MPLIILQEHTQRNHMKEFNTALALNLGSFLFGLEEEVIKGLYEIINVE